MQNHYRVAIIGGGASGLISAVMLAKKGFAKDTVLLERCDRVGKKLAVTGNGQGNLFNLQISPANYHDGKNFVEYALKKFDAQSYNNFLRSVGIITKTEGNKVYPLSKQANAVVDMYRAVLQSYGVEIKLKSKVTEIKRVKNVYQVAFNGESITCDYVIFACGGKCAKQFGTDGTSYELVKPFGHKVTPLYPSLVQLKCENSEIRALDGVKCEVSVSLSNSGGTTLTEGDILFTKYGVSGSAVFYLSAYLKHGKENSLNVDFLPQFTEEDIEKILAEKGANMPNLGLNDLFTGIINKKVGEAVAKRAAGDIKKAAKICKNFRIEVTGTLGFDYAQVTKGGIELGGVNAHNMESIYSEGLYIIGEALNVDGDCGGYNLQWAYSSASACCNDIIRRFN